MYGQIIFNCLCIFLFILGSRLLHSSKQHQYSRIPDLDVNVPVITVHVPTVNLLPPTSPVLCCTPAFHPAGPPLLSGFFSHVVLGHTTFLFSSGCHSITTMQSSFLPFLSMWPIQFHLLPRISSLTFFMPIIWGIVLFWMGCATKFLESI